MTPTEQEALLARTEKATTTSQITTRGTTILPTVDLIALLTLARKAEALEGALRLARPWVVSESQRWTLARLDAKANLAQIDAALGDTPT
jgi:hypothetical protein